MKEMDCKECNETTECSKEAVAVTCSDCVTLLISGELTENY